MNDFKNLHKAMIDKQIVARGIKDKQVIAAFEKVKRENFVVESSRAQAYADKPLPIILGQTISQPYIVAYMVESLLLEPEHTVLEVGTGSGYAAAIMAEICSEVYTVERIEELSEFGGRNLRNSGYKNVHLLIGDGTLGWEENAPYDAILVSAGGPVIPRALEAQLKIGGHMVIPVGSNRGSQELVRITRVSETEFKREDLANVRFVPLIGRAGWEDEEMSESGKTDVQAGM